MYPTLKYTGPTPIHEQISAWIRKNIASGKWRVNYKLQAEEDLAHDLSVSRGTVRKAIETLVAEGLLSRIHGRGTFVRSNLFFEQQAAGRLAGFSQDLLQRGIPFTTDVPFSEITVPSPLITRLLGLKRGQEIFHMRRIRRIRKRANILIENHIVYEFCRGIEAIDFRVKQLYVTLEDEFNMDFRWARRTYKSQVADSEIAECLEIDPGAPVMYLEELYHVAGDTPAEFTRAWFDGDLFHITTLIQREDEKREVPGFYR